jgi:hypothetical protein
MSSTTTAQPTIDYSGLWIGIGIGVVFLILFSVLLFFYLRYRKQRLQLDQKKHIANKANALVQPKPLTSLKSSHKPVDIADLYNSNNRSDNRLMDDLARRNGENAFNIFSQTIKTNNNNGNVEIQIRQEITAREGCKIVSIKKDDIKIEIIGNDTSIERKPITQREERRENCGQSRLSNAFIKEYNVKQVLCYTDGLTSEPGDSLYKGNIYKMRNEYIEMKKEEQRAREKEEEIEQEYNTIYKNKEKSTADDEKQTDTKDEFDECQVDNEFEDEDIKTVNNFEAKKLANAVNKDTEGIHAEKYK